MCRTLFVIKWFTNPSIVWVVGVIDEFLGNVLSFTPAGHFSCPDREQHVEGGVATTWERVFSNIYSIHDTM